MDFFQGQKPVLPVIPVLAAASILDLRCRSGMRGNHRHCSCLIGTPAGGNSRVTQQLTRRTNIEGSGACVVTRNSGQRQLVFLERIAHPTIGKSTAVNVRQTAKC